MTRLTNDPRDFAQEMTDGFVLANSTRVRRVDGGVVRARALPAGRVAVVVGGGSGHYPAFAGFVGEGMAAGAAMGNLFASPAAAHVVSVAQAVESGGGVLLSYGNYAGDVLNFSEAQDALRAKGIACETVVVTDDISSAPPERSHLRRGIAGDFVIFKCAGAAAEAGRPLADVARVARRANEHTRTIGAAFSGCALPGASRPLFEVAPGRMALGMGIHGEPGIGEMPLPSADELARTLVEALLADLPRDVVIARGTPVVPILNGLGSVKYEEMFVVYRRVAQLLGELDLEVVDPQVGEFCTSFDMAGISLTLFWPDAELGALWAASADTPAYRRVASVPGDATQAPIATVAATPPSIVATAEARQQALRTAELVEAAASAIDENVDELGRLDAIAGDGDHGIGMQRGIHAALAAAHAAIDNQSGVGSLVRQAGEAWGVAAGGTSGALWASALKAIGSAIGDAHVPTPAALGDLVLLGSARVQERGGAVVGDKTMIDSLVPFASVLDSELAAGAALPDAWVRAATAARTAAAATADLVPRMGRARTHVDRSMGSPDAGAVSFAIVVSAVAKVITEPEGG